MTWVLVILLQCGMWGCNHVQYVSYPDKESCYEAMDRFVKNHGFDKKDVILCQPNDEEKKK